MKAAVIVCLSICLSVYLYIYLSYLSIGTGEGQLLSRCSSGWAVLGWSTFSPRGWSFHPSVGLAESGDSHESSHGHCGAGCI